MVSPGGRDIRSSSHISVVANQQERQSTFLPPGLEVGAVGYRIGRRLQQGGVGDAYAVLHPPGDGEMVVRVLPLAGASLEDLRRALAKAGEAASPVFPAIHAVGSLPDGRVYVVSERLRGQTLAAYLRVHTVLAWANAVALAREIASALARAHAAGVAHGFLRPEDIFLRASRDPVGEADAKGPVAIIDLGIARALDETATWDGASDEHAGMAADVGALGRILYRAIAGHPPPDAYQPLPRVASAAGDLPDAIDHLIAAMLAPRPEDRPAMAQAMAALDAFAPAVLAGDTRALAWRRLLALVEVDGSEEESLGAPTAAVPQPQAVAAPPRPDRPPRIDENVQFTVFRPRAVVPERWYSLLAFAHLSERRPDAPASEPDPVQELTRQAQAVLGESWQDYRHTIQEATHGIPEQGTLTLVPTGEHLTFDPPRVTFVWRESVHRTDFRVRAGAAAAGSTARGRLTVFLGAIIVGDVPFAVQVDTAARSDALDAGGSARAYRRIFASYSHADTFVVRQFEQLARAFGDHYLGDWLDLRSGEQWSPRLEALIAQADVFQLFWSSSSMRSAYVRQEWEFALSLGRPFFVRPTYWESPLPEENGLPPPALKVLQFARIEIGAVEAPKMTAAPPAVTAPFAVPEETTQAGAAFGVAPPPRNAEPRRSSGGRRALWGATTVTAMMAVVLLFAMRTGGPPPVGNVTSPDPSLVGQGSETSPVPEKTTAKPPPRIDPAPARDAVVRVASAPRGLTATVDASRAPVAFRGGSAKIAVPLRGGKPARVVLRAPGYQPLAVLVDDDTTISLDQMKPLAKARPAVPAHTAAPPHARPHSVREEPVLKK